MNSNNVHSSRTTIRMFKDNLQSQIIDDSNFYRIFVDKNNKDRFYIKGYKNPNVKSISAKPLVLATDNLIKQCDVFSGRDIFKKYYESDDGSEYITKYTLRKSDEEDLDNGKHEHEKWVQIDPTTNEIMSYVTLTHTMDDDGLVLFITELMVCEAYRGMGNCKTILKFVENRAIDCCISRLVLDVYSENTIAYNTYKKHGFIPYVRSV